MLSSPPAGPEISPETEDFESKSPKNLTEQKKLIPRQFVEEPEDEVTIRSTTKKWNNKEENKDDGKHQSNTTISSIEHLKHLRKEKDEVLKTATQRLSKNGHLSTIYPPVWMDAPGLIDRLPKLISIILCIASIAGMIWATTHQMTVAEQPSMSVVVALVSIFPFVVGFSAYNICSLYPLDYIERLNFLAIVFANIGAVINLIFGQSYFVVIDGMNETLGVFIGTTALSLGTLIFSYCTFVLGPWEFMVGTPLLSIGLLLRNCSLYFAAFTYLKEEPGDDGRSSSNDVPDCLNAIAFPFVFMAIAFVVRRSYHLMRLPLLGSDNYRFFGILSYGWSVLVNTTLSIVQQTTELVAINSTSYRMVTSVSATLLFFGTSIFLLFASRVKHHYDAMIEDRFPSTTSLVRTKDGMKFAVRITPILASVQFGLIFVHLVEISRSSFVSPGAVIAASAGGYAEFTIEIFTAISLLVLSIVAFYPSLEDATKKKEKNESKLLVVFISGFAIFVVGNFANAILRLVIINLNQRTSDTVLQIPRFIAAAGALVLIISTWPRKVRSKIFFLDPSSWENILVPCNYVLLTAVWLFVGQLLKATSYSALGALSHSWAYCVLMFHFSMAYYVWESMNLEPYPEDEFKAPSNEDSSFEMKEVPDMEYDVLISGGGISGLMLGCILGQQDLKVAICK